MATLTWLRRRRVGVATNCCLVMRLCWLDKVPSPRCVVDDWIATILLSRSPSLRQVRCAGRMLRRDGEVEVDGD